MKNIIKTLAAIALLSVSSMAGDLINLSGASKAALSGFDTVAFFTDARPVNGVPGISAEYQGAVYYFATRENQRLFKAQPEKYVPQFGGFCAYGASLGKLFPVDISTWQVRDGKLYLNMNPDIRIKFDADFEGNVARASNHWPRLVKKHSK